MTPSLAATIAARFPLVARKRPPAKPLDARVDRLVRLAETAHRECDPDKASMVFNGAALVASDCGDPTLPAPGASATQTSTSTEPRSTATRPASLSNQSSTSLACAFVKATAMARTAYHPPVHGHRWRHSRSSWTTWRYILDNFPLIPNNETRSSAGCATYCSPTEPAPSPLPGGGTTLSTHVRRYDGNRTDPPWWTTGRGRRPSTAERRAASNGSLTATKIETPWEQAVHALLMTWLEMGVGSTSVDHADLIDRVSAIPRTPGLALFRVCLGLTALDLAAGLPTDTVDSLIKRLVADAIHDQDANAACDLTDHPAATSENQGGAAPFSGGERFRPGPPASFSGRSAFRSA